MQQQKLEPPLWGKQATKQKLKNFCVKKHDPQYICREDRALLPVENKYATNLAKIQTVQPQQGQRILRYHDRERQGKHCMPFLLFLASGYTKPLRGIINHNNYVWRCANEISL